MVSFDATLEGTEATLQLLEAMAKRLTDTKGFYEEVANETIEEINKSFQTSESPMGDRWPALKKKRPDGSFKPLLPTNPTLANSFRIISLSNNTAVIGSTVDYGRWHQFGTDTIPRRAFMPFKESGDLVITPALAGIIVRATNRWFGKFDFKDSGK